MSKSPVQSLARNAQEADLFLEAMPSLSESPTIDPLAETNFTFEEKFDHVIDVELGVEKTLPLSERRLRQLQRAESNSSRPHSQRRLVSDSNMGVLDRLINWIVSVIERLEKMLLGLFVKTPPPPVKFVTKTKEELEREEREKEALLEKARRIRGA